MNVVTALRADEDIGPYQFSVPNFATIPIDLSVSKQHRAKGRRGKLPFDNTPQLAFPSFLTPRQKAQDGAFYMMGDDGKSRVDFAKADYDEIIIPKGCKEAIRGELE